MSAALSEVPVAMSAALSELHLDLLCTTSSLDFRDALALLRTCSSARAAIVRGPLFLSTDVARPIAFEDINSLMQLLRWCGPAVRELRLDQQPRALWPAAEHWGMHMSQMPYVNAPLLGHICISCPSLETLSLHDWVAFTGFDVGWGASIVHELARLPRLRRVTLPSPTSRSATWRLDVETLLRRCPDLVQLNIPIPNSLDINALSDSNLAARLKQLSLYNVPKQAVGSLWRCPGLRRLHLHECELEDLNLCQALPGELRVLTLEECQGDLAYSSRESLVSHFGRLQALDLGKAGGYGHLWSSHNEHAMFNGRHAGDEFAQAMCSFTQLRVLSYNGSISEELDDVFFAALVKNCPWLHTLLIAYGLSADGFNMLLDATVLPHLRVLNFTNAAFETDLDDFFSMSVEELDAECEECLKDPIVSSQYGPADIIPFFAFCRVVVTRGLATPLERQNGKLLPAQAHIISHDYFELGLDV